jgi:Arc/MetJ family transcription regulator
LDIDHELLEEVAKITKEKSKSRAVGKALQEYVRRKYIDDLRAMLGKVDLLDNWRELEELEVKEMRKAYRTSERGKSARSKR